MRSAGLFFPFSVLFVLSTIPSAVVAKPIHSSVPSIPGANAIAVSNSITSSFNPVPDHRLSKRVSPTTIIAGGWQCTFGAQLQCFNHIPAAARYLEDFYQWVFDDLNSGAHDGLLTGWLSISDGTFQLIFKMQDTREVIPLYLIRAFVTMMLRRTQRGWVGKYAGWLIGPGGVVVDVILQNTGSMSTNILDSAMDMYGS